MNRQSWNLNSVLFLLLFSLAFNHAAAQVPQLSIDAINRMPHLPAPYNMRDWNTISKDYYRYVFDSTRSGYMLPTIGFGSVRSAPGFGFSAYIQGSPEVGGEAMTCLGSVVGGLLLGMPMKSLYSFDFVDAAKDWYDPYWGIYQNRPTDAGNSHIDAGIYGYWPVVLSLDLMAQDSTDTTFKRQLLTTVARFKQLAMGLGCPNNCQFYNHGFDLAGDTAINLSSTPLGTGFMPAWINYVGYIATHDSSYLQIARAATQWQLENPMRDEIIHLPGPLLTARLNAEQGAALDESRALDIFFGTWGNWEITAGITKGGLNTDGLDAVNWGGQSFYAFTMGSLQGPGWLIPVARYNPSYARAIAIYALNAANSARLLEGVDLDWNHQDHLNWKQVNDTENVLFYEGMINGDWQDGSDQPYATGDPIRMGWYANPNTGSPVDWSQYKQDKATWFDTIPVNLALYMGNQVGFLGSIFSKTNVDGIIQWDCLKTDYFHQSAYPTFLYYNPTSQLQHVNLNVGTGSHDVYDVVQQKFLLNAVTGTVPFPLDTNQVAVLVITPAGGALTTNKGALLDNGVVISYSNSGPPLVTGWDTLYWEDVESGATRWNFQGGTSIATGQGEDGSHAFQIVDSTTTGYTQIYTSVPVSAYAQKTLLFSYSVRYNVSDTNSSFYLNMYFTDAQGNSVGNGISDHFSGAGFTYWSHQKHMITIPASATEMRIVLSSEVTAMGTMWIDNIALIDSSKTVATPTYLLSVTNGSGSGYYPAGASIKVTSNASGSTFSRWSGDTTNLSSTTQANVTLTMPAHGVALVANTAVSSSSTTASSSSSFITTSTIQRSSLHYAQGSLNLHGITGAVNVYTIYGTQVALIYSTGNGAYAVALKPGVYIVKSMNDAQMITVGIP